MPFGNASMLQREPLSRKAKGYDRVRLTSDAGLRASAAICEAVYGRTSWRLVVWARLQFAHERCRSLAHSRSRFEVFASLADRCVKPLGMEERWVGSAFRD
ncbi:MAG: hypothetical protein EAZ43_16240 [Betaproteobacteria bacterium]|nr:MAG: hypothetical protein EAZ43_16240 [Betaproteobacteria bacterium]